MKKILIVDDEKVLINLLQDYFKSEGFTVFLSRNKKVALEICEKENIDLVLLDIKLEEDVGFNISNKIFQNPDKYGQPKIIAMSGYISGNPDKNADFCKDYHIDSFISKPFELEQLLNLITVVLNSK